MSGDKRNEAVYRALTGRSPRTEPQPAPTVLDFHGSLNLLYGRVKSQTKLADMLGVPRRTLRRWLGGQTPSRTGADRERRRIIEESAKRLIQTDDTAARTAVRRGRLTAAREAKVRNAKRITIVMVLRYAKRGIDDRTITFHVGEDDGPHGMDAGVPDEVVNSYLNGATADDNGAFTQNTGLFAPIAYGMTDEWYREAFLETAGDAMAFDVEKVVFS